MSVRTELEHDIYDFLDDMDPSGKNTERMRNFLKPMDDMAFYRFMDEFFENDQKQFPVAYEAYDNPVNMDFIHDVAKKRNVPIYERVYRPYLTGDTKDPPGTVYEMMVVDVPIKRLKQMAFSKNHAPTAGDKRDPKSGQVSGEDRTARVTDVEGYSLMSMGQYYGAQEYYGPRGDDLEAYYEMLRLIQRDGEVELRDLPNNPESKVALNTVNAFMLGSGLVANWVSSNGYILPNTLRGQEEKFSTIDRG